jgi:hypothetical protein
MKYLMILSLLSMGCYANDNKIIPSVSNSKIIIIKKIEPKEPIKLEPKFIEPKRNYNGRYNQMQLLPQRAR